jgi:5'-nucleotidase
MHTLQRRLYLDLDGVMADFDRAYQERFGTHPRQDDDAVLWARIDSCPEFFAEMHPCEGALDFFNSIRHLHPVILTACPKTGYAHAARHKIGWVRKHLCREAIVLPVMGGINKPLFMHKPGDILIDDYRRNIEAWRADGGIGILHRNWAVTRAELAAATIGVAREIAP